MKTFWLGGERWNESRAREALAGADGYYRVSGDPHLMLRVAGGRGAWYCIASVAGRTQRMKIPNGAQSAMKVAAAERACAKLLADIANGLNVLAERATLRVTGATLADSFAAFREGKRVGGKPLKASTLDDYERALRTSFAPFLSRPIDAITTAHTVSVAHECAHGAARTRIALAALRALWNFTSKRRVAAGGSPLGPNPVDAVRDLDAMPRAGRRTRYVATADMKAFLDGVLAIDDAAKADNALALLLMGLRRGECEKLAWGDLAPDCRTATLRDTKNRTSPVMPVPAFLAERLAARRQEDAAAPVFPQARNINKALARIVPRVSPHDLRRTFASVGGAVLGRESYVLRRLLNHAVTDITEQYVQVALDEKRAASERIEHAIMRAAGRVSADVIELRAAA